MEIDTQAQNTNLNVRFYKRAVEQPFKSKLEKRPVFEDADFVHISVPGNSTVTIDTFAQDHHKERFPLHWAHYQNIHGKDAEILGTPITEWPRITRSQAEELKGLKFHTVEAIAGASDGNIQRIGMIAGMSPYAFREAAQRYLKIASEDATVSINDDQLKKLAQDNENLRLQMEHLMSQLKLSPSDVSQDMKPKRGRPKRTEEVTMVELPPIVVDDSSLAPQTVVTE